MIAPRRRILHVEDSEDDARYVREILPVEEFSIAWAKTAAEAWKYLSDARFDLLLLDYGLTDTNGLLFLEQLRTSHPDIPVIVLSGRKDDALSVSMVKKGAANYLIKEGVRESLPVAIGDALGVMEVEKAGLGKISPFGVEAQLSKQLGRLSRILLATMNEGCCLIDIDGTITFANEAAGRMMGCGSAALLGQNLAGLLDAPTANRFMNSHRSIAYEDAAESFSVEGTLLAGMEPVPVLLSIQSVHNELGKYESCIVVLTDISELTQAKSKLEAQIQELTRLRQLKDRFISVIVHDLRTPLGIVKGAAKNILDGFFGGVEERQRQPMEMVWRNARRMERLIKNLTDLSQLETGVFRLNRAKIDLRGPVRQAADDIRSMVDQRGLRLALDIPDRPVLTVSDSDRITQIVLDFLDNALRFASSEIRVGLAVKEGGAFLAVEDDGPGIPPELVNSIFDRVVPVDPLDPKTRAGLGLSIVRAVVEAHGGKVWAENIEQAGAGGDDPAGGTRFVVRLPIDPESVGASSDGPPGHP